MNPSLNQLSIFHLSDLLPVKNRRVFEDVNKMSSSVPLDDKSDFTPIIWSDDEITGQYKIPKWHQHQNVPHVFALQCLFLFTLCLFWVPSSFFPHYTSIVLTSFQKNNRSDTGLTGKERRLTNTYVLIRFTALLFKRSGSCCWFVQKHQFSFVSTLISENTECFISPWLCSVYMCVCSGTIHYHIATVPMWFRPCDLQDRNAWQDIFPRHEGVNSAFSISCPDSRSV